MILDGLISYICSYFTVRNLVIYVLISTLPAVYVKLYSKKLRGSPELNQKYAPFARIDYENWGFFRFALVNIFTLVVLRYVFVWCMLLANITIITLCKFIFCHKKGKIVSRRLDWWMRTLNTIPMRLKLLMIGVFLNQKRVEKDYSKWLGPDWKPTFEGYGIQVSNHISWLDILALVNVQHVGFIADVLVRDIPLIGSIAEAISSTFLKRAASKEEREKTLQDIMARQIRSEQGEMVPLHIFPEACSTNGTHVIKLSKGAFYSLRKVRPTVFSYRENSSIKAS